MRKVLKYLLIILAVGMVLVALTLGLLQTSWLRDHAKSFLLDEVNNVIAGEITTGAVEGNLFSGFYMRNIELSIDGQPVVTIPSARIEYEINSLLDSRIKIRLLEIDSAEIHVVRENDSTWNVSRALSPRQPDLDSALTGARLGWTITVDTLRIRNLTADVVSGETTTSVNNFAFLGSGLYCNDSLRVNGAGMSFQVSNPMLEVEKSQFTFSMDSSRIELRNLEVKTKQNRIVGDGRYDTGPKIITFDLETDAIYMEEFRGLTGEFPLKGHPELQAEGTYSKSELNASVNLQHRDTRLEADIRLDLAKSIPEYSASGSIREFEVDGFVGDSVTVSPLNGSFSVEGKGFVRGEMILVARANLNDFWFNEIDLGSVDATVSLKREDARIYVRTLGPHGDIVLQGSVRDIKGSVAFMIDGSVRDLNINPLYPLSTDITGTVSLSGSLSGPDGVSCFVIARADSAMVDTILIDRFTCAAGFAGGRIQVDSLLIVRDSSEVYAHGVADTSGAFDAGFVLRANDRTISGFLADKDAVRGNILVRGNVSGTRDSIRADVSGTADSLFLDGKPIGRLSARFIGEIHREDSLSIVAESLAIAWNEMEWRNSGTIDVTVFPDGFDAEPFAMTSNTQRLDLGGTIHTKGYSDFQLNVDHFEIAPVAVFFFGQEMTGVVDLIVKLHGARRDPDMEMSLSFKDGTRKELDLPDVEFHAEASDSVLNWKIDVGARAGTLTGEGTIPLRLNDTSGFDFLALDRPMRSSLKTSRFDLSLLQLFKASPVLVTGYLDGNLNIGGTLKSPDVEGSIRIDSATVSHPGLGIAYSGIRVRLTGNKDALVLEEFSVSDSALTGSGRVAFSFIDSLRIEPDLVFRARNFDALSGPQHFATIDGDVQVDNDQDGNIRLEGEVTITRSRFYLPSLQNIQITKDLDPPLLVVAAGRFDTASVAHRDSLRTGPRLPSFKGRLTIRVPRATWLRGPRTNVELSGNVEITSEGGKAVLRGFLAVEQGTYEFYGRRFVFNQGRIDFDGGTEVDPSIYFEVEYPFRTDEVENRLVIVVRGKSRNPQVEFFFNKDPISESDAISYIVFGRKVDDLNYGQQSTVTDLGDALAMDLAANMINSQLSSVVGSRLGLDVVRVSGEDNWNKAVLTAGKYVTDDIFVAYERGVVQSSSSSVVFESARLEYYLMKFLYLHLIEATDNSSGVDVFLKFE